MRLRTTQLLKRCVHERVHNAFDFLDLPLNYFTNTFPVESHNFGILQANTLIVRNIHQLLSRLEYKLSVTLSGKESQDGAVKSLVLMETVKLSTQPSDIEFPDLMDLLVKLVHPYVFRPGVM